MKIDTQRLWLYEIEQRWSDKNSEHYYECKLWDNENGYTYITYLSDQNYNMFNWQKVIDNYAPDRAVCLSGQFRTARGRPNIVNADCKPMYEGHIALTNFCDLVYQAWRSEIDPALNGTQKILDLNEFFR